MDTPGQPSRTWEEIQALKDDLFERAKVGEITGEEADAEAIRLGLGSLSRKPGPDEFRPEAMTHWTLPMAVAWIAYLDLDEVREWSVPYRTNSFHWIWQRWQRGLDGPIYEGWHLEQRSTPTLSLLALGAVADTVNGEKTFNMSVGEAEKALWIALRADCFRASGIGESGRRVEIPPLEWNDLKLVLGSADREELRFDLGRVAYREVLLPAASIRGLWREHVESSPTLPPIMQPSGFGFMPLFCAAQWIATEGGTVAIDPADVEAWRPAFRDLLAAIASEAVKAVGVHEHQTKLVPSHLFVGLAVDYPYTDASLELILSNELVLRSYPYVDEEHWRKGFDDALVDRGGDRWVRLSVEKSDIARLWPRDNTPPKSGTPGRPTSAHLFKAEMELRATRGDLSPTLAAETRYLSKWLQDNHPTMPQALPGSIEEVIRTRYWELRSQI